MTMPGFSAESSIYEARAVYGPTPRLRTQSCGGFIAAIHCDGAQRLSCHIQCNLKGLQCDVQTCHCWDPVT
jgi:hypothetical protein